MESQGLRSAEILLRSVEVRGERGEEGGDRRRKVRMQR